MSKIEETRESLKRIQEFDSKTISRENDLGTKLYFADAIKPANKLIQLYKQLSLTVLEDLPDNLLDGIKRQADADFNKFQQALNFDPANVQNQNPAAARDAIINNITSAYPPAFNVLWNYIAYGVSKSVDFQRMENEARSMIQSVKDKTEEITQELQNNQIQSGQILNDMRKAAAEQGVSQQAIYFKEEAVEHEKLSNQWKGMTLKMAIGLGIYAIISLFVHKIPWLSPHNTYESVQLVSSKILIFGVISYIMFLAAKNFLSHKHNAIVNKHRQNALMTFKVLIDAGISQESKDIVLTHASACIFSPQETGYIKVGGSIGSENKSIIELLPKAAMKMDTN